MNVDTFVVNAKKTDILHVKRKQIIHVQMATQQKFFVHKSKMIQEHLYVKHRVDVLFLVDISVHYLANIILN